MGTWKIKSSLEEWEKITGIIEEELLERGFSNKFMMSLMLATDEVFANIASYAYGEDLGDVIIESVYDISESERSAKIIFIDYGKEFDPIKDAVEPDIDVRVAIDRKIGGLGIFLTKKQVDELKYSYENNSNKLVLTKKEEI